MRAKKELIYELEKLFKEYETEVEQLRKSGALAEKTATTYLVHSRNFVRWLRNEFEPGRRNK